MLEKPCLMAYLRTSAQPQDSLLKAISRPVRLCVSLAAVFLAHQESKDISSYFCLGILLWDHAEALREDFHPLCLPHSIFTQASSLSGQWRCKSCCQRSSKIFQIIQDLRPVWPPWYEREADHVTAHLCLLGLRLLTPSRLLKVICWALALFQNMIMKKKDNLALRECLRQ